MPYSAAMMTVMFAAATGCRTQCHTQERFLLRRQCHMEWFQGVREPQCGLGFEGVVTALHLEHRDHVAWGGTIGSRGRHGRCAGSRSIGLRPGWAHLGPQRLALGLVVAHRLLDGGPQFGLLRCQLQDRPGHGQAPVQQALHRFGRGRLPVEAGARRLAGRLREGQRRSGNP